MEPDGTGEGCWSVGRGRLGWVGGSEVGWQREAGERVGCGVADGRRRTVGGLGRGLGASQGGEMLGRPMVLFGEPGGRDQSWVGGEVGLGHEAARSWAAWWAWARRNSAWIT